MHLHYVRPLAFAVASAIGTAYAQSSKDFASMGVLTWAAFECSSLAAQINDTKQQERLFMLGYEQGQAFVAAARTGKVDRKAMSTAVPLGLVMRLEGPSVDFILGRVYAGAQENALKDVFISNGQLNSEEVKLLLAQSKFRKANCSLVGTR